MNDITELIMSLAMLITPICMLAIVYIFRAEIKNLINKDKRETIAEPISQIKIDNNFTNTVDEQSQRSSMPKHSIQESKPLESVDESTTYKIINNILVCKNIKSGKYFIVIDEDNSKLITPESKTIQTSFNLFTEPEELDEYKLLEDGRLTKAQVDLYYCELEKNEQALISYADGHKKKHSNGIEPQYIGTYRNMLSNPNTMPSIMLRIVKKYNKIMWIEVIELLVKNYGYKGTGGSLNASLIMLSIDGRVKVDGVGDSRVVSIT